MTRSPERFHGFDRCLSTPHGSGRPIERREEPVACRVDLPTAVPSEQSAKGVVMLLHEVSPSSVTELGNLLGRPDDVGEEHGREDPVELGILTLDLADEALDLVEEVGALDPSVHLPGKLDELRAGDAFGDVPAVFDRHRAVVRPVHDQGGDADDR